MPQRQTSDRARDIDYLIGREYPELHAAPPPGSTTPHYDRLQQSAESGKRRRELQSLSESELQTRVARAREADDAADRERRAQATPPLTEPIPSYWIQREEWSLSEGVLLLIGVEPRSPLGIKLASLLLGSWLREHQLSPFQTFLSPDAKERMQVAWQNEWNQLSDSARNKCLEATDILANARSAVRLKKIVVHDDEMVLPRDFLLWARKRTYEIPDAFAELMQDLPISLEDKNIPQATADKPSRAETLNTVDDELKGGGLKFVAYFARKYGYDLDASKNDATSKIIKELERVGLKITDKTVRKFLKLAIEKYPKDP